MPGLLLKAYSILHLLIRQGDLSQFNQCQTQLFHLFEDDKELKSDYAEFVAYRILYFVVTDRISDLMPLLITMDHAIMQDPIVSHALQVRTSVTSCNYHRFFLLYESSPMHGKYLLNHLMDQMRYLALLRMQKSYRFLPVDFLLQEFFFNSREQCIQFLNASGVCIIEEKVDLKHSKITKVDLSQLSDQAVTHGSFR